MGFFFVAAGGVSFVVPTSDFLGSINLGVSIESDADFVKGGVAFVSSTDSVLRSLESARLSL